MRVTFITGSLEPGKDGVGDYTRWLAAEAARRGVSCRLIALADKYVAKPSISVNQNGHECLRLPATLSWAERVRDARTFIASMPPDWLSVQFVPYSFHKWGVAASAIRAIRHLRGSARLHVMFHEIWIDGTESWRRGAASAAQRQIVLALGRTPGAVVHTSNATYCGILRESGVPASTMPLFGSIPLATASDDRWLAERLGAAGCDALHGRRHDWWLAVLFGTLHPVWPAEPLFTRLGTAASAAGKKLALISVGRLGAGDELWNQIAAAYRSRMPMIRLDMRIDHRVSSVLSIADFGIATTPRALIGKSATVAAMFDHGLPVIVNREDCVWPAPEATDPRERALVIRLDASFAARLRDARRLPPEWRLPQVATQWLNDLTAAGDQDRALAWSS
jgi:hypothetical protein